MGEGLAGVRDRVVLNSKSKAGAGDRQDGMMTALEGSLKRLRTDYLDVYFNHAVNDVRRMQNEEWWAFTERAKQQGKIRFRGMSGHGGRLAECLDTSRRAAPSPRRRCAGRCRARGSMRR
jgi:predicted aldo/keto reductase-like oxidoreductase